MNDEKTMVPDLQASLLCDDVRQERNGKFILIGIYDGVSAPGFPVVFQRICVVNRWCCGEGTFYQHSRILKPDGDSPLVEGKNVRVQLPNGEASATSVEFFMNVKFETEGTFWIEILMEGDLRLRYPLRARRVSGAQNPRPPAGPDGSAV